MDMRPTTLKAHLRQADRLRCRYAILLGDDEAAKGSALLRDMVTKGQKQFPIADLASVLVERLNSTS